MGIQLRYMKFDTHMQDMLIWDVKKFQLDWMPNIRTTCIRMSQGSIRPPLAQIRVKPSWDQEGPPCQVWGWWDQQCEQNQRLWRDACTDHGQKYINFHIFSSRRGLQTQLNNYMSPLTLIWARGGLKGPRLILLPVVPMFGIQSSWNFLTSQTNMSCICVSNFINLSWMPTGI